MFHVFLALKDPARGKSRLASLLAVEPRAALVTAMACDVVEAVLAAGEDICLWVIGSEHWQRELPGHPRLRLMNEACLGGAGLNALLRAAVDRVDPRFGLVLHGDLPFLTTDDIAAARARLLHHDLVLCSDAARVGTNAIGFRDAGRPAFCFGRDSYATHCRLAEARGRPWSALARPGFARDVDTPADLRGLLVAIAASERVGPNTARWAALHGPALNDSLRHGAPPMHPGIADLRPAGASL